MLFPFEQAIIVSTIALFVLIIGTVLFLTFKPTKKPTFETTPEQQALIEYQKALELSKRGNDEGN
jgi:hypothetical protein